MLYCLDVFFQNLHIDSKTYILIIFFQKFSSEMYIIILGQTFRGLYGLALRVGLSER